MIREIAIMIGITAILVACLRPRLEPLVASAVVAVQEFFATVARNTAACLEFLRQWLRAEMEAESATPPTPPAGEHGATDQAVTSVAPEPALMKPAQEPESASASADAASLGAPASQPSQLAGGHLQYFIGSVLYTLACALFVAADLAFIAMTVEGFSATPARERLPFSPDILTAAAVGGTEVFWGLVLFDLHGVTRLARWHRLRGRFRRYMLIIAWASFGLCTLLALSFGVWRGWAYLEGINQAIPTAQVRNTYGGIERPAIRGAYDSSGEPRSPSAVPEPAASEQGPRDVFEWLPAVAMAVLAVLLTISALCSGLGVATLLQYLVAIGIGVVMVPLALIWFAFRTMEGCCERIYGVTIAIIGVLERLGRPVVDIVRPVYVWCRQRLYRALEQEYRPPSEDSGQAKDPPDDLSLGNVCPTTGSVLTPPEEGPEPDYSPTWDLYDLQGDDGS